MLASLVTVITLSATTAAAAQHSTGPGSTEVAPVQVVAPRPPAAKSHQQVVADRWSPHIVTCRPVFVQGMGVTRQVCATNRAWEIEHQRFRHEFMQAQWHWIN